MKKTRTKKTNSKNLSHTEFTEEDERIFDRVFAKTADYVCSDEELARLRDTSIWEALREIKAKYLVQKTQKPKP